MTDLGKVVGAGWLSGSGTPTALQGLDDDHYLDIANGDVYKKIVGSWVLQYNLTGPSGATGAPGIAGANGADANRVFIGESTPASPSAEDLWISPGDGIRKYGGSGWEKHFSTGNLLRHILSDSLGGFESVGTRAQLSGTGTVAAENQQFGPSTKLQSSFAQVYGVESQVLFQTGARVELKGIITVHATIGANTRYWLGLFETLPTNTANGGTPHIAVNFDNSVDTYWALSTYNGTTQTRTSSLQKGDPELSFAFHFVIESGTVTLDIFSYPDYTFLERLTSSTDLPTSELELAMTASCGSTTGAARLIVNQLSISI